MYKLELNGEEISTLLAILIMTYEEWTSDVRDTSLDEATGHADDVKSLNELIKSIHNAQVNTDLRDVMLREIDSPSLKIMQKLEDQGFKDSEIYRYAESLLNQEMLDKFCE